MQFDVQTVMLVGLGVAAVGGVVMYLLGHRHSTVGVVHKVEDTIHEVAHTAAEAVQEDVHHAVAGVVKVLDEVKTVRPAPVVPMSQVAPKPLEIRPVEAPKVETHALVIGDPTPAPRVEAPKAETFATGSTADQRQKTIDQAKATYGEAKDRLGADHPDVKQASGDVMKLAVGHAQAVAAGR